MIDNEHKKSRILLILMSVIIIIIVAISIAFWVVKENKIKSHDESLIGLFNDTDYKVFYSFGQNTYDENANCYDYNYNITECTRETEFDAQVRMKIVNLKNRNNIIDINFSFNNIYEFNDIELNYEYKENYEEINSPTYIYTVNKLETEDYSHYYNESVNCYDINFSKKINYNNIDVCSSSISDSLKKNKDKALNILSQLNINNQTLYKYVYSYFNNFIKENYIKSIDNFKNVKITPNDIDKALNRNYFETKKFDNNLFITSPMYVIMLNFSNYSKVFQITFAQKDKPNIILMYNLIDNAILGSDGDKCSYVVSSNLLSDYVLSGKYCDDDTKFEIKFLKEMFENILKQIGITQNELIDYANYYYNL